MYCYPLYVFAVREYDSKQVYIISIFEDDINLKYLRMPKETRNYYKSHGKIYFKHKTDNFEGLFNISELIYQPGCGRTVLKANDKCFCFHLVKRYEFVLKSKSKQNTQTISKPKIKSNGKWLLDTNYKHVDVEDVSFEIPREPYKRPAPPEKVETVKYGPEKSKQKHKSNNYRPRPRFSSWADEDIAKTRRVNVYNSHSNANNKPEEENGVNVRGVKAKKR